MQAFRTSYSYRWAILVCSLHLYQFDFGQWAATSGRPRSASLESILLELVDKLYKRDSRWNSRYLQGTGSKSFDDDFFAMDFSSQQSQGEAGTSLDPLDVSRGSMDKPEEVHPSPRKLLIVVPTLIVKLLSLKSKVKVYINGRLWYELAQGQGH